MNTDTIIRASGVSFDYSGGFRAVRDLNLAVVRGETFALLGTNGAGKTTTLEVLEGFVAPTEGSVMVFGASPMKRAQVRPQMGIMLQDAGFASDATVAETLTLAGAISGREDSVPRVLDVVNMTHRKSTVVQQLSGGEKRRLDFACAIWGSPELLFLDEPTTGLDPEARERVWSVVEGLQEAGTTIMLTTHYLEEAENHADRIAMMHQGEIVREGELSEIVSGYSSIISCTPSGAAGEVPDTIRGSLTLPGHWHQGRLTIESGDPQRDLPALLHWADREGLVLGRLEIRQPSLRDMFAAYSRRDTSASEDGSTIR